MTPSGGAPASRSLTSLARLAVDTGGRYTERTNDLTLGFARAQRDLTCVYTLGFYDRDAREDDPRELTVRVRREGVRAVHPSKYVFRSESAKSVATVQAAFLSPESFDRGVVRAHAYPLKPASRKAWAALLAVSFPVRVPAEDDEPSERDFGAVLYEGSKVVHRFQRRVILRPRGRTSGEERSVTFLEPVTLKPGTYALSVVLKDPATSDIEATRVAVEVDAVPRKELFVLDPLLGRAATGNVVVRGSESGAPGADRIGSRASFEPLLVQRLAQGQDLVAISRACFVGKRLRPSRTEDAAVRRQLRRPDGEIVGELPDVGLVLEEGEAVRCQELVDVLPGGALREGAYEFEVELAGVADKDVDARRIPFAVAGD